MKICVGCGAKEGGLESIPFGCKECGGDLCLDCYLGKPAEELTDDDMVNLVPYSTCKSCHDELCPPEESDGK